MPNPVPTAMALWNQHASKLLEDSRHPMDTNFELRDFLAQLFQILSPRLPLANKRLPTDWGPLESALTVAFRRYQYLRLPREQRRAIPIQDRPRPLKILLFGGSVLKGTGCTNLPGNIKPIQNFANITVDDCSWGTQLEYIIESFFHYRDDEHEEEDREPLFRVSRMAWGGTGTTLATFMFKYNLLPEDDKDPDIVINGFSTNDAFRLDTPYETLHEFVRVFLDQTRGQSDTNRDQFPPLLLFLDDFQGGGDRMPEIWDILETSRIVDHLSSYYGFATVSYADVNRDLVLGDTHESWFSPTWYEDESDNTKINFEVHPNMGGHVSIAWTVIYGLLHMVSTYCSIPTDALHNGKKDNSDYQAGLWGLPELSQKTVPEGKPRPPPGGLPPELNRKSLLDEVSLAWRTSSEITEQFHSSGSMHCPFWWSFADNTPEDLMNQATVWDKWKFSPYLGGHVLIGSQHDRFVYDFAYPDTQIRSILFVHRRSWKYTEGNLRLRVWSVPSGESGEPILLAEKGINPYNPQKATLLDLDEIHLKTPVEAGEALRIEGEVTGKGSLHIMGIGACGYPLSAVAAVEGKVKAELAAKRTLEKARNKKRRKKRKTNHFKDFK
jgi:hypothetical protein